jgi:hypothetical protein
MARRLPSNSKSSNSRNLTDFQNLIPSHELFLKDEFIEKSGLMDLFIENLENSNFSFVFGYRKI